jgi:hypothetical protein
MNFANLYSASEYFKISYLKLNLKLSLYTPRRRLGGEEI